MKNKRKSGFTLAEMLLTVAIITVLLGVSFVAFMRQQRSMTRLEYDSIAKEIFVAAQNHLTAAESQGYLDIGSDQLGAPGKVTGDTEDDIYYILSSNADLKIKELMLPPYAIEPFGSYIIRYQLSSAKVLDVFYSLPGRSSMLTVAGKQLEASDYSPLMGSSPNYRQGGEKQRERYDNAVVGWYGGEDAVPYGARLEAPTFEVINAKTLYVKITDPNTASNLNYNIKLIITGQKSGAEAYFSVVENKAAGEGPRLQNGNEILLDSVTDNNMHFAQITPADNTKPFYPGEDITVKAVAYSTDALANVAMSAEKITNSLFADPYPYKEDELVRGSSIDKDHVVGIANCRHLENLDSAVSKLGENSTELKIEKAFQTDDLDWDGYGRTYALSGSTNAYWPVTPSYSSNDEVKTFSLLYDGQGHSVSNVMAEHSGNAGLFGSLSVSGSKVENLKLVDFAIKGTDAGALVGSAANTEITNVVAYNSPTNDAKFDNDDSTSDKLPNVTATGAAGGLIGSMSGGKIEKSAAALYVNSTGTAAGGLIGSVTGDNNIVTACYSGGHTYSGDPKYAEGEKPDPARTPNAVRYYDANNDPMYNVSASSGTAGGLIGSAGSTTISGSYSTCSASGATAGGFVGSASGDITDCYCTGLVPHNESATVGAFAGALSGTVKNSAFFEIVNEIRNSKNGTIISGYHYLTPVPIGVTAYGTYAGITALDLDMNTYDSYTLKTADAEPYDSGLITYYQNKYNLKPVSADADDFVAIHHGDWPAPEEFIFN